MRLPFEKGPDYARAERCYNDRQQYASSKSSGNVNMQL